MKTVEVRTVLKGEAADALRWMIQSVRATNKTAALRLAILSYRERRLATR